MRIFKVGTSDAINDHTRNMFYTKYPEFAVLPSKKVMKGEYLDFPFAEDNSDRAQRNFITASADATTDDAWSVDTISGRDEIETKLAAKTLDLKIKLSCLDVMCSSSTFFNNNHEYTIEIEFNDDPREYLVVSGKKAKLANADIGDKLFTITHRSPPELLYQNVELTQEMSEVLSDVKSENPIQYMYTAKKFKVETTFLKAGDREANIRLSKDLQPLSLLFGLISVASYKKSNHFQESGKFYSPSLVSHIEFTYTTGNSDRQIIADLTNEDDKKNAFERWRNFCLNNPTHEAIDPADPDNHKWRIQSEEEYFSADNNSGLVYFDLTSDRKTINFADHTPYSNSNMHVKYTLKAGAPADCYIVVWLEYTQKMGMKYNPSGNTIFTIMPGRV